MDNNNTYKPSSFVAMFSPQRGFVDKQAIDEFAGVVGAKPDMKIELNSFMVQISLSPSTKIAVSQNKKLKLILHGEVYGIKGQSQADFLLEEFQNRGTGFINDLNGLFSILIVDEQNDAVFLITDRLNSRKVFCRKKADCYWLSTSLSTCPTADLQADPIAVAYSLSGASIHNNRTLFDGIKSLEKASIHSLTQKGFQSTSYWKYEFTNSYAGRSEEEMINELSEMLIESVRLRVADNPALFLSLSAGYDASGILGILASRLKYKDVSCISYAYGKPSTKSDAYVASQMADLLGVKFSLVQSHDGDIVDSIKSNSDMGQGMSNFCDEIDFWKKMAGEFGVSENSVLVTGDGVYPDAHGVFLRSGLDALSHSGINDFSDLLWLRKYLSKDVFQSFHDGLAEDLNLILERCPHKDFNDIKDFVYLDQRVSNTILPWRFYFAGSFITVRHPFLDNSFLDFMKKLPGKYRYDKLLYRKTMIRMFPDIFAIKRATQTAGITSWRRELIAQEAACLEAFLSGQSKLDKLIPPDVILRWMKENKSWNHSRYAPRTLPARASMVLLRGTSLGNMIINHFPVIDLKNIIRRVLVLRCSLRDNS